METNTDTDIDQLLDSISGGFIALAVITLVVWLLIAFVAAVVAPDDRPWDFFWCTLFLLGPLGIALALVAPARPSDARESVVRDDKRK